MGSGSSGWPCLFSPLSFMKLFKNFNLGEIEVRPSAEAAGMAASIFLMAEKV